MLNWTSKRPIVGHTCKPKALLRSNDNPFPEAQFKTVKYHPGFSNRFGSYEDALSFLRGFFPWYNREHTHSGILYLAPETGHSGRTGAVLAARHRTKMEAYFKHPERHIQGQPKPPKLPKAVYINPPRPVEEAVAEYSK